LEYVLIVLLIFVIFYVVSGIKFIPQQCEFVVERLGKYNRTLGAGVHVVLPFIEQVRGKIDLRLQQIDIDPQDVITRDNVGVTIDSVVFYQVTDARQATYSVKTLESAITSICRSAMRQSIGKMLLDETLEGREKIAADIRTSLDEATYNWGIRIDRVEILDINPPQDIRQAMNLQMQAEREKRAAILKAEAEKQSAILMAEGHKQSVILKAEGDKEARIQEAEGIRTAQELEAAGRAEAIRIIAEAEKRRIEQIKAAGLDPNVLAYRSFEALEKLGEGAANTVFVPNSAADTLAAVGALTAMAKNGQDKDGTENRTS
jgi:regulator of protease activity HflC (stomatin/prohibitin superfamily)